jgi:hypothetical protein
MAQTLKDKTTIIWFMDYKEVMRKLERQSSKRIDIQVGDRIYSLKPLL